MADQESLYSLVFNKDRRDLETDIIMTNMSIIQFISNLHLTTISRNQSSVDSSKYFEGINQFISTPKSIIAITVK